ncbi:MAG TPA: MmcQ/YjbR family DNA-binding protein [Chloroflexota bacterium]
MVTVDEVRAVALPLPRSYEVFVYGRRKFRVGQIVYLAFSRDETTIGFGFPKEWRAIVVEAEPHKFMLPSESDMRFNWVHARLGALEPVEMRDLVLDAWRMCVPKRVAAEWEAREAGRLDLRPRL